MRKFILMLAVVAVALPAAAQKHELAFGGGVQASFNPDSNIGTGVAVGGSYARRLAHVPAVALYFEVPVVAAFKINSELPSAFASQDYSSLFLAPGFKVKLVPELPVSPYFTAGAGWARYRMEETATDPARTTNTALFQYGFGVDYKVAPFISFRTEVRDYYTGGLQLPTTLGSARQHNVVVLGGIVFRL